jgi:aminoglycoside phosphotransferase (APT) family kinase protein
MDRYALLPTVEQLGALGEGLGETVRFHRRIVGGLGGTVDVLVVGADRGERVVLKRYWLPEPGEISPAESEFRALALAAARGISAPSPIWIDRMGLFPERAIVISYVEGAVLLGPADPNDWAAQLADTLIEIHRIQPEPADQDLFPALGDTDGHHSEAETLAALRRHPLGMELWATRIAIHATLRPEDPVYVHHDFWPGNTLWIDERLAAVVDWEGGSVADPALDVAYCAFDMRLLGLNESAEHFVDVYREHSGRTLENLRYWELLALCRPMPDIAMWVPGWQAMGKDISADDARRRHTALIRAALEL